MKAKRDETFINRDCDDVCTANIHFTTEEERYWQQVRVQAAIAALGGLCANFDFYPPTNVTELAIQQADKLVEELKKN